MVRTGQDEHHQYYKAINKAKREMYDLRTDLMGNYQTHNIKTILTAAEMLTYLDFKLPLPTVLQALSHVKSTTGLRGRWDRLQERPAIICDVAHNPAGLKEVLQQFAQVKADSRHIVLGFVKDKDVNEALSLFPKDTTYYFCNAQIPRALPASELKEQAEAQGLTGNAYATVSEAIQAARDAMVDTDALLITGSFFIVGEALEVFSPVTA
jgi:dihydrofolate synthase/folylpolyglutamate synthase